MRGKKGERHLDPNDPPRRRGNKRRGHGSWETDRPPVVGAVSRADGRVILDVCRHASRDELESFVFSVTSSGTRVNTDAWRGYAHLKEHDRPHATVDHSTRPREWARDDDGDGVRETHTNSVEGLWTGLRNFLRPFRGVHKKYLHQYVSVFAWTHNLKQFAAHHFAVAFTLKELPKKMKAA